MSKLAAIICLIWVRQKFVVPVQFERPSTGRHGPLNWPPLAVNHWNTLTLTRRLVELNDACGPNRPSAGWADIRPTSKTTKNNSIIKRARIFDQLPGEKDFFGRPMVSSLVRSRRWSSLNWTWN